MLSSKFSFNLPVMITKQNKRFVAYTPALDISTSGKSEREVKQRFSEIISIFLEEIIEAKIVDDVLLELGWQKVI
jgi:predicted RNase H-like HicB family nuclease